jgi:hypothetical protein
LENDSIRNDGDTFDNRSDGNDGSDNNNDDSDDQFFDVVFD